MNDYLLPKVEFDLNNNFTFIPSISSLCIINSFAEGNDKLYALIDYPAGNLYFYGQEDAALKKEVRIPKTCNVADVLYVFSTDSILYLDNTNHRLIVCDTTRVRKAFSCPSFLNSNAHFSRIQNNLQSFGEYLVFDILVDYNSRTAKDYYDLANHTPCIGLFKIEKDSLRYVQIPIFNPTRQSEKKKSVSNFPIFVTDLRRDEIIYTTRNNCDTIFSYHFPTNTTQKSVVHGSNYPIEPIFYDEDTIRGSRELAFSALANKHNTCSRFIFDQSKNNFYRLLTIRDAGSSPKKILQVLNREFTVKLELEVPAEYIDMRFIEGELLFHRIDRRGKKTIYEKFLYNS